MGVLDAGLMLSGLAKELWSLFSREGIKNFYWLVRRRYSSKRLREQMYLVHREIAHKARDLVAQKASDWKESVVEADEIIRDLESACDAGSPVDPELVSRAERHAVVIETDERDLRQEVDGFLCNACDKLAGFFSRWMSCDCYVSAYDLDVYGSARHQEAWAATMKGRRYVASNNRLLIDTGLDPLPDRYQGDIDSALLAAKRGGCERTRSERDDCPPFKLIDATTPFNALLWASNAGDDVLYQCHRTRPERNSDSQSGSYKDPNPESQYYNSVVVVPFRGSILNGRAELGFLWIDAPKSRVFRRMFRWDQDPRRWTAGLHLLHCIADVTAIVLTTERAIRQDLLSSGNDLESALDEVKSRYAR